MFIRVIENPEMDDRLWYKERQGDVFHAITFNGLQYIVSDPTQESLMAIRMEDAQELEESEEVVQEWQEGLARNSQT